MIFATVGTQLPFDRLTRALAGLAPELGEKIVAQVGAFGADQDGLDCRRQLTPAEFEELFTAARVVVAHAGIGTMLSARRWGKPLVVVPRRYALGEHRNDHQVATARQIAEIPGLYVAWKTDELGPLLRHHNLIPASETETPSRAVLVARLRAFVEE
ncbi:hypothetical protein OCH239_12440 [Roseivivax halodurans JCM 10272]|uniref:Glycosyl transferase family 28 C-terminal domain-containing protein n=1 Tax=Roseivivax halodurans JCM 10272 TaxID=1449350 RepID=X7EBS5_9RHOB|nr:glycosyltransferase [Roseivivax halodurans]ETX13310.1 hypothetical protein OCH239_12440 [Roseivivax halodurans JCM 10272]